MASLPTARASRGTPRCYGATRSGRRARGGGIARELEVRERGLQIAARSKLLRVLRGERRKIRMVLDRSKYFDRLAVRLVGRAEVATRVSGCGADAQRVGLLAVVAKIGKAGSGARGEAQLAGSRRHGERELVRGEGLHRAVEPAVDGAEMDERPRAETRVGDLALLHDVARGLERFGAGRELAVLHVQHTAGVEQLSELGGVAVRIDKRHRLGQPFERLLSFPFGSIGRGEVAEKRGALAGLRLQGQR